MKPFPVKFEQPLETYHRLNDLSRSRALSRTESAQLERAMRDAGLIPGRRRRAMDWTIAQDAALTSMQAEGVPFVKIAAAVNRTEEACHSRLRYLRSKGWR